MNPVHFSSEDHTWETPRDFFAWLHQEFRFSLDVCATPETAKCDRFFTPDEDGLEQPWTGTCWMNPPYGRQIGDWVKKAWESARAGGATVVCLVPARTDTAWWNDWALRAAEIRFVRGRLKFSGSAANAPFPVALLVFRPGPEGNPRVLWVSQPKQSN